MNKRAKQVLGSAVAAATLSVGLVGATATTAAAASGCSWGTNGSRGAYSSCASGFHRSWVSCRQNWWPNYYYTSYGPWQNGNTLSISNCGFNTTRKSYGIQMG